MGVGFAVAAAAAQAAAQGCSMRAGKQCAETQRSREADDRPPPLPGCSGRRIPLRDAETGVQATARKLLDEGGVWALALPLPLPPLRRKLQGNVLDEGNGQGSYPTD